MKLASRKISIRVLMPFVVLGLAVLLAPLGAFAQTAPQANDDSAITAKNTEISIDVAYNDTDAEGDDTLDLESVEPKTVTTANGTAVYNGDGTFKYTPNTDFLGTDVFTYTILDDTSLISNAATVTIEVIPANAVLFNVIPKKLNLNRKGVIPVEIRGTEEFDVSTIVLESLEIKIDPASIHEVGFRPVRSKMPGRSNRLNIKLDGQQLLREIVRVYPEVTKGDVITVYLTGNLDADHNSEPIFGQDTVIITGQQKTKHHEE